MAEEERQERLFELPEVIVDEETGQAYRIVLVKEHYRKVKVKHDDQGV